MEKTLESGDEGGKQKINTSSTEDRSIVFKKIH
jgi:hypothetical protein